MQRYSFTLEIIKSSHIYGCSKKRNFRNEIPLASILSREACILQILLRYKNNNKTS